MFITDKRHTSSQMKKQIPQNTPTSTFATWCNGNFPPIGAKKNGDESVRIFAKNTFSPKGWTLDVLKSAVGVESRWKVLQNGKRKLIKRTYGMCHEIIGSSTTIALVFLIELRQLWTLKLEHMWNFMPSTQSKITKIIKTTQALKGSIPANQSTHNISGSQFQCKHLIKF